MAFIRTASLLSAIAVLAASAPAQAREVSPSAAEMFAIGTSGTVCEAQGVAMGAARRSIFERKWAILCSDVARPVGSAFALRGTGDVLARAAALRGEALECGAASDVTIEGMGTVRTASCRSGTTGLEWKLYSRQSGATLYAVEGLAGYDSALRLALANLVADRIVPGEVQAANLGTGDAQGIAKARAAVGGVDMLIGQGYRSNSAGAYTEAAELFAAAPSLIDSDNGSATQDRASRLHELKVNRALQLSNLGDFDQAARLFGEADALGTRDGVQARLARNFEVIDAINRGELGSVAAILDRPVPPVSAPAIEGGDAVTIDRATSAGLNATSGQAQAGLLGQETRLSPSERARILDAQALQLRGTVQRREGQAARQSEPDLRPEDVRLIGWQHPLKVEGAPFVLDREQRRGATQHINRRRKVRDRKPTHVYSVVPWGRLQWSEITGPPHQRHQHGLQHWGNNQQRQPQRSLRAVFLPDQAPEFGV